MLADHLHVCCVSCGDDEHIDTPRTFRAAAANACMQCGKEQTSLRFTDEGENRVISKRVALNDLQSGWAYAHVSTLLWPQTLQRMLLGPVIGGNGAGVGAGAGTGAGDGPLTEITNDPPPLLLDFLEEPAMQR
jgi:hypothetical protein